MEGGGMEGDGIEGDQITQAEGSEVGRHELAARLWVRAHHEAAHAVVGTLLGGRVEEIAIWGGPPVGGRVMLTGLGGDSHSEAGPADQFGLVRRIVYHLAGPIGEQIASGGAGLIANEPASRVAMLLLEGVRAPSAADPSDDPGAVSSGAPGAVSSGAPGAAPPADLTPDIATVVGLLLEHFGPDGEAELAAAVDHLPLHVENLLRERWGPVEVIAVSLLRHGRLTDEQVRALFAEALPGHEMAALLDPSSA
jgi:hypothetical protein